MSADIGIFGLSARAVNLAVNLATKEVNVAVGHRSSDLLKECSRIAEKKGVEERITTTKDYSEFCESLSSPKRVILMAKPGSSVEKNYSKIVPLLSSGDVLVDGSDEGYETCLRRAKEMEEKGVHYLTMGVLGTDKEVQKGCGILLSGPREGYDAVEVSLKKAAAEKDYEPCIAYVGSSVSAAYAMMVLKGLLTSYEQVLAEVYGVLLAAGFTNEEVSKSIATWNKDDLESPLLEAMCVVLKKKDADVEGCEPGEGFLVDKAVDCPVPLREGASLLRESNDLHASLQSVVRAVYEGFLCEKKEERAKAASLLAGPEMNWQHLDHVQLVEDLRNAFIGCVLSGAAECFALLRQAGSDYQWNVQGAEVARVLAATGVCRCGLLTLVKEALEGNAESLFCDEAVAEVLQKKQLAWRRAVTLSVIAGITAPVMTAALAYMDTMRREKLPQNLVNAQRDFFASATFERTDMPRGMSYHCRWTKEHN